MKRYEFDPVFKEDYEDEEGEWVSYADHFADRERLLMVLRQCVKAMEWANKMVIEEEWGDTDENLDAALAAARDVLEEKV